MSTAYVTRRDAAGNPNPADSVTLDDGTGVAIRRSDGASALATGAANAVVFTAPDTYSYDYGVHALDPTYDYTISFRFVEGALVQVVPVAIASTAGLTTLRNARRALAERLAGARAGACHLIRAGVLTDPAAGTYVGTAGGPLWTTAFEQQRHIVSSDLVSTAEGGGEGLTGQLYDSAYVYVLSAVPEQRAVSPGSYVSDIDASEVTTVSGSDERVGYLALTRRLAAAVPAGTQVEIHTRLPVLNADGKVGLHWCLNEALSSMRTARRVSLDAVSGRVRYEMDADWLDQDGRILGLLEPEYLSGYEPYPVPSGHAVRRDGGATYLTTDLAYTTGQSFALETTRPAKTWIRVGGAWQDSRVGLVNESDEAAVPLRWLVLTAYYYAADVLSRTDPRGENTYWATERDRMRAVVAPYLIDAQQLDVQRTDRFRRGFRRPTLTGTSRGGWGRSGRGWP